MTGLVAPFGDRGGFPVRGQPADRAVIARKEIARWLAARPEILTEEQVSAIHDVARRSDT